MNLPLVADELNALKEALAIATGQALEAKRQGEKLTNENRLLRASVTCSRSG